MKDSSRFSLKEVSADAGYLSRKNTEIIQAAGAKPYIMPSKQVRTTNIRESTAAWGKMIKLWKNHQALFAQHYHRRSNVESTFGSWKIKWGDRALWTRSISIIRALVGLVTLLFSLFSTLQSRYVYTY